MSKYKSVYSNILYLAKSDVKEIISGLMSTAAIRYDNPDLRKFRSKHSKKYKLTIEVEEL